MSTNDVPGHKPQHKDVLAAGCWAEHEDGSLIFVEGTENGRVIFSVFDLEDIDNVIEYRDAMNERDFKVAFSFDPKVKNKKKKLANIKWTWHDKTAFPWDRIMDTTKAGPRRASAEDTLNAAQKIRRSRNLRGQDFSPEDHAHLVDQVGPKGRTILTKIQRALDELRG